MDKLEIIADIEERFEGIVLEEKTIETHSLFNRYEATVKVVVNEVAEVERVQFFVFDEGTGSETAYYRTAVPRSTIDPNLSTTCFLEVIEAKIAEVIAAGVIEKGTITEIDEEREKAVVSVYALDSSVLYNRLYLIWRDRNDNIKLQQIVQE